MGVLLSLLHPPRPALDVPCARFLTRVDVPPRPRRRPETPPLESGASLLVRPYGVAAEQAARRHELLLAELGFDGPGPYVIHGMEVA
ncbi:hypothetical protein ABZ027_09375 [Streptomyces sp. NPDC006332]|uniref:hypothetical protein n=1 Tax=Streptomyces sp. NPDC006332 TaxID=3155456 RepID=UPI0033AAC620